MDHSKLWNAITQPRCISENSSVFTYYLLGKKYKYIYIDIYCNCKKNTVLKKLCQQCLVLYGTADVRLFCKTFVTVTF